MREFEMLFFLHISPQQEAINSQSVEFLSVKAFILGIVLLTVQWMSEWMDG